MPLRHAAWIVLALSGLVCGCGDRPSDGGAPVSERAEEARRLQEAEAERTGFPVEVGNDLGMRFRIVPPGSFSMGCPEDSATSGGDDPAHEVRLITPCYLQTREVTLAEFRRFRPEHPSHAATDAEGDVGDQPVVGVTHDDALAFAAWLHARDPRWRYRLPTESEWEFACREGGLREPRCTPGPNAWGIEALHGPVAEWCHDRYGPYPLWLQDNPQGSTTGGEFVVRGSCPNGDPDATYCTTRAHHPPGHKDAALGFRLAMSFGYARHDHGRYEVVYRTVDPTAEGEEPALRPGYGLKMISVVDRLTDRRNHPAIRPIWTDVRGLSPQTVHLPPGRYYVYAVRRKEDRTWIRGNEIKFDVPGRASIEVPVPREDQEAHR